MCQEYVAEKISQVEFQNRFNQFVQNRLGLPEEQQFVATNILEKLDAIKNDNKLLKSITSELEKYLSDHNNSHFDNIRTQIDNDFKNYRRDPRFRKAILEIL
jgi:histidyl-tRNA synthetase